jgi:FkbM family methyltransferase
LGLVYNRRSLLQQPEFSDTKEARPRVISIRQPAKIHRLARSLKLGWSSTAKLFGAYYFGRRAVLKGLAPDTVVLDLPDWGKVTVRVNGYDHGLLDQIFVRQDYRLDACEVRRILDLGANIGMATVYLHRLFPEAEIACVEPSPQNIPVLKRAVSLNGIHARVFEAAAGAESGTIDLHLSIMPDCNSIYPSKNGLDVVTVPLVSVPEIMEQMRWNDIDILKIDIEGAEKEVLGRNNSWLRRVRIITGEGHPGSGYPYAELQSNLQAFGFVVETLIPESSEDGASFRAVNSVLHM